MFPPLFKPPFLPDHFITRPQSADIARNPAPLTDYSVPVGAIIIFPGEIIQQTGQLTPAMSDLRFMPWMICDGTSLLIAEYPDLYRVIGGLYGADGNDHFNLPDYRGFFLRGVDIQRQLDQDPRTAPAGRAVDPQGVGSTQRDALRDHQHVLNIGPTSVPSVGNGPQTLVVPTTQSNTDKIVQDGKVRISDTETRSVNIAVNWLIRTQ